jgi:putative DNA primase/helicase
MTTTSRIEPANAATLGEQKDDYKMDTNIKEMIKKEVYERQRTVINYTTSEVDISDTSDISTLNQHDKFGYLGDPNGYQWAAIIPLDQRPPSAPFPIEYFPESMRKAIKSVTDVIQSPIELAAISALAIGSTAVQSLINVKRDVKSTPFPTSLYLLAIAESGERKSTIDSFFEQPLIDFEIETHSAKSDEITKYKSDKKAWESSIRGIEKKLEDKPNDAQRKSELESLHKNAPQKPLLPVVKRNDITVEALGYKMATEWPYVVIRTSDAANFFDGHSMKQENITKAMSFFCEIWSGNSFRVDRRGDGRGESSYNVRGKITLSLMIQPDILKDILSRKGNKTLTSGFLARFLIAYPRSTQGYRIYQEENKVHEYIKNFSQLIKNLLKQSLEKEEKKDQPLEIYPSEEAKEVFVAFYNQYELALRPGYKYCHAKELTNRVAEQALRIAAIFETLESTSYGTNISTISTQNMLNGCKVAEWFLEEGVAYLYVGKAHNQKMLGHAHKIAEYLTRKFTEKIYLDQRLYQSGPCCFKDLKAADRKSVYELLQKHNFIKISPDAKILFVNPKIKRDYE